VSPAQTVITSIVLIFAMIFGVGAIAILAEHFQKMAKIRADAQQKQSREVLEAVEALRRDVAELRDTTTKYDLSFDTALQRLENRVAQLEDRARAIEPKPDSSEIHIHR